MCPCNYQDSNLGSILSMQNLFFENPILMKKKSNYKIIKAKSQQSIHTFKAHHYLQEALVGGLNKRNCSLKNSPDECSLYTMIRKFRKDVALVAINFMTWKAMI